MKLSSKETFSFCEDISLLFFMTDGGVPFCYTCTIFLRITFLENIAVFTTPWLSLFDAENYKRILSVKYHYLINDNTSAVTQSIFLVVGGGGGGVVVVL